MALGLAEHLAGSFAVRVIPKQWLPLSPSDALFPDGNVIRRVEKMKHMPSGFNKPAH